ncbi:MAG: aminotransferase class V-fold PLP-dependent enzyme [Candidatus Sericytochromatia bacterium]|nr:aminotransferase class V-fold PLP-dependent enzyme [Candidatus Sericytochromatia bacterium]
MRDHLPHLERGLAAVARWQERWAPFPTAASLALSDEAIDEALAALADRLTDNYPFHHPAYAGQMLKPPHPVAMLAYAMAMQINPNNHALDGGPATAALEEEVVAALATMLGFESHLGHLTGGGTMANLEALWVARRMHPERAVAYGAQAHYTHARLGALLGLRMVEIPVDRWGRLDLAALAQAHAREPLGTVVVTAGTTALGAIDPIDAVVAWARENGVRVHVDAAYGGFFKLLSETEPPILDPAPWAAIAQADSVVIDPHKHGLQPYGCGCVIFRDPQVARFYAHEAPYAYFTAAARHLGEISLECSRAGAAAAALWTTLRCFPLAPNHGLGPVLKACRRAALAWAGLIEASPHLQLVMPPDLDIVAFFPTGAGWTASAISTETEQIFQLLMRDAHEPVYLATARLPRALVAPHAPQLVWDQEELLVLRACLIKPEHELVIPWLHARVERYASPPEAWEAGAEVVSNVVAPVRALTGPLNLKAEWQRVVEQHLAAVRPAMLACLRDQVLGRRYHEAVERLDVELCHPYGVAGELGLRLYTLGADGWLVSAERPDEDAPFSGSEPLLPELAEVVPAEVLAQPRFLALKEALEDAHELAGKHLIDWFAGCWQEAGGAQFPLQATLGFADDEERLDLRSGEWQG